MANPTIQILRAGDTSKPDPFTICIVANPALEAPTGSGQFIVDPIIGDLGAFNACADYINLSLFGGLPNQREQALGDPSIAPFVRVVSIFETGLSAVDDNSLVGQDDNTFILNPRRITFRPFLQARNLNVDVAYAVSKSDTNTRASAWFTTDDDSRGGVTFTLDGQSLTHRYYNLIPGTIGIHTTATSVTALHEFHHAISSYSNGRILDLYVDSGAALNCKVGRPIPPDFAAYNGAAVTSDPNRDGLGYPDEWQSYHCELNNPNLPALMDDYWAASPNNDPNSCENDHITRQFVMDRLRAKIRR
jgi:hypothetical protein